MDQGSKACSKCQRVLPLTMFYGEKNSLGDIVKRRPDCKECKKAHSKGLGPSHVVYQGPVNVPVRTAYQAHTPVRAGVDVKMGTGTAPIVDESYTIKDAVKTEVLIFVNNMEQKLGMTQSFCCSYTNDEIKEIEKKYDERIVSLEKKYDERIAVLEGRLRKTEESVNNFIVWSNQVADTFRQVNERITGILDTITGLASSSRVEGLYSRMSARIRIICGRIGISDPADEVSGV